MKSGNYTLYKGKEYRVARPEKDYVTLVSKDKSDISNGFECYNEKENIYIKKIKKEELTEVYRISSHAVYQGTSFALLVHNDDSDICVLGGGEKQARKFPMTCCNKAEFTMEVPKTDVEVIERRRTVNIEDL